MIPKYTILQLKEPARSPIAFKVSGYCLSGEVISDMSEQLFKDILALLTNVALARWLSKWNVWWGLARS